MDEIKYIIKESDSDTVNARNITAIIRKRFRIFISVLVLAIIVSLLFVLKTQPYYDTKISIGSAYFTGNAIEPMIIYLSDLRNDGNFEMLSENLNISVEQAKSILKIQVRNKTTQKDFFTADISLRVSSPENIIGISNGLMIFFEQNNFIKNRVEVLKNELEDFTTKGERELLRLDSLKKSLNEVIVKGKAGNSNIIFPSNIHLEGVQINEKVYQARKDLKLVKVVELLSQPAVPSMPSNPSNFLVLISGLFIGFALAVFVVLFVESIF
jgi:LPS O-antigen subunit length determinant protein (WzzB/FepE family)